MKKRIIIPDRVFHKLWDNAISSVDFQTYYSSITSSTSGDYINLLKYNINIDNTYNILKHIYEYANLPFSDLMNIIGIKKSAISHRFCIPIRTVENWCDGSRVCSSYLKLMIMECFNINYLPKGVYTQSLIEKFYPSKLNSIQKEQKNNKKIDTNDFDFDRIDNILDNIRPENISFNNYEHLSLKKWEEEHLLNSSGLLDDTDYLTRHMKK